MELSMLVRFSICLVLSGFGFAHLNAQEQSVKPGINDTFRNPNVKEFVERFEGESREIFDKRNAVLKACDLKPGQAVADIGAGTGLYTRLFAQAVGEQGKVYAVDISQKFLDYIRETADKLGFKNIKTILGKDASPELAPNSVDVVFICDTYHHFEFPYKIMKEIHAAMKPGGKLIIIDFIRIPGQSREWVLNHVRAGQDLVEKEITQVGFTKNGEHKNIFKENYFIVFEKNKEKASGK
ncbi:MAG: class I SAM-dependent methyltransferase [Planctomycetia bacterium]|nr:class I SAM-dependent methyltransferase [Planctomycetia bacterium]